MYNLEGNLWGRRMASPESENLIAVNASLLGLA